MFKEIKDYILAGNSTFILSTPFHKFYYNVKKKENTCATYYVYSLKPKRIFIGSIFAPLSYPFNSNLKEYGSISVEVFELFINDIWNDKYKLNIKFEKVNTCAKCGRLLTDEKSIERGYGPCCYKGGNNG